jgi:hypothetical protein
MLVSCLALLLLSALVGCGQERTRLSIEEARACATNAFKDHPGRFSHDSSAIAYSFDSPGGPAKVIVVFAEDRRPERTFFESAPHGSHQELMDAASAIKACAEHGRAPHREIVEKTQAP